MTEFESRIEVLENQKKELMGQYAILISQQTNALSDIDKRKLQNQIDELEKEIENLENKIRQLKPVNKDDHQPYRSYHNVWEDKLPQLNFKKSKRIIQDIFSRLEDGGEEQALFLLQRSRTMRGDLCIKHIKLLLQSMDIGDWYPPFEYSFLRHQPSSPEVFLNALASRFSVESLQADSSKLITLILDKVCKSLVAGNVFLLLVEFSLRPNDAFLGWFVNEFWCPLVKHLNVHRDEHPFIKVVGVLAVRNEISKTCLPIDLCCKKQKFDSRKILELPLENWSDREIHEWLSKHSKLSELGYGQTQLKTMAETIYAESEKGKPLSAYDSLMETLKQSVLAKRVS